MPSRMHILAKAHGEDGASCGPEGLAADLAERCGAGYRIKLCDFMPGTAKVETLVILRRESASDQDRRR